MNRQPMNHRGYTLLEILVTVALLGLAVLTVNQVIFPMLRFFQHSQPRQQASQELRMCMETLGRVMSNGKAATVVLQPPLFSSLSFQSTDGSSYTIALLSTPPNTVHLQKTTGGVTTDTVLASHVSSLTFGMDDRDPGIVNVTLQMTVPLDSSGTPDSFLTIIMPQQTIRMMGS